MCIRDRSGTTATVETTGPHGIQAGEQVEISGVTTTGYDGVYEVHTALDFQIILESGTDSGTNYLITEDGDWIVDEAAALVATDDTFTITVSGSLTTPATVGVGKVKLVSPFDNSTRDVTLRPHTDVTVYPLYGDWATNQRSRYGLGPRQSNAGKYMWATPPTEYTGTTSTITTENHQITLELSLIHI